MRLRIWGWGWGRVGVWIGVGAAVGVYFPIIKKSHKKESLLSILFLGDKEGWGLGYHV